ncbi:MAG: helix-turn-helix transcriptional regulator [Tepidisphaeraceae bacterium]|jgi:DNA-binding XRE family transcriptional regulator
MKFTTLNVPGGQIVVLSRKEFDQLAEKAGIFPALPPEDRDGNSDALAFMDATIARTLIRRRIEAGLTQKDLAKLAGVRLETISRVESGKHEPTRETILRLETALKRAEKKPRAQGRPRLAAARP